VTAAQELLLEMTVTKKNALQKAKKGVAIRQVAAVPYRLDERGELEILLITSRETKRFIVPKGWPMKGKSGRKTAAIEAAEEAGVAGKVWKAPGGTYSYWKRLSNRFVRVNVVVYLLSVTEELASWRERKTRQRAWLSAAEAASLVDEPELATLIRTLVPPEDGHDTPDLQPG
jgi:8-oxo-dGTP pyrophosphatase MutT (NUDIX family)